MGTYTFNRVPKTKRRNSHSYARPNDFISIPNAIPAIVSKETFLAAQEKMLLNKNVKAAHTRPKEIICCPVNSSAVTAEVQCRDIPAAPVAICTTTIHVQGKIECLRTGAKKNDTRRSD